MNEKILVFEDSEPLRQSILFILTEEGFSPITASSIEEVSAAAEDGSVAMMIADVQSSITAGTELLKSLTGGSTDYPFPVILFHNDLTGAFEISDNQSGKVRFITKPFSRDVLVSAVHAFLA